MKVPNVDHWAAWAQIISLPLTIFFGIAQLRPNFVESLVDPFILRVIVTIFLGLSWIFTIWLSFRPNAIQQPNKKPYALLIASGLFFVVIGTWIPDPITSNSTKKTPEVFQSPIIEQITCNHIHAIIPSEDSSIDPVHFCSNPPFQWDKHNVNNDFHINPETNILTLTAAPKTDMRRDGSSAAIVSLPRNGDFQTQVTLEVTPTSGVQLAGIGIRERENRNRWVRLVRQMNSEIDQMVNASFVGEEVPDENCCFTNSYTESKIYLRIAREGRKVSCSYSSNGDDWVNLPSREFPLSNEVEIFLLALSTNNDRILPAQFSDFGIGSLPGK
jgi:regulation of enolase protein 1 (concanavalin A-like superfamily)